MKISINFTSHHITNDPKYMYNIRKCEGNVRVGDGNSLSVKWYGDIDLRIVNYCGSVTYLTLKDVSFVPSFKTSLFSITLVLEKGMELSNFGKAIRLESKRGTGINLLEFHKILKTDKGYYCGLECERVDNNKMVLSRNENWFERRNNKILKN